MSDTKEKENPSADEIVDDLAEEMGVDEASDDDASSADEAAEDQTDGEDEDSTDEDSRGDGGENAEVSGIEGVFSVKKGKKKKKRKKKKKKKSPKEKPEGVDEIFSPDKGEEEDVDLDDLDLDDDLGTKSRVNKMLVLVILVLLAGGLVGAHFLTLDDQGHGLFHDIGMVLTGEYRDHAERERERIEDEHREKLMDAMPQFGRLHISGSPRYAQVRLNGEIPYGETTQGRWREVRTGPQTVIEDLSVDEIHEIEVDLAGHETFSFTLHEDMWDQIGSGEYIYRLSANLTPRDNDAYREFSARTTLGGDDRGGPYLGTVRFNTEPPGATILINGYIVRDEDGQPIVTPAEFDEYWTIDIDFDELSERDEYQGVGSIRDLDEETLDLDEFGLRERDFLVTTPPDQGNAIELFFADEDEEERIVYGTVLQRNMWECQWKDEDERARISDDDPIQEHCDYFFEFDIDFVELADFIERREEERERIAKERQSVQDLIEAGPDGS